MMNKYIAVIILVFTTLAFSQTKYSKIANAPGAFSRMGFGARGMGMGNSMSAVVGEQVFPYYNPALSNFSSNNSLYLSYSSLGLDRSLNFVNFTKTFKRKYKADTTVTLSTAFSFGVVNAGVSDIEERNNDGTLLGNISTSENMFYLNFSNQMSKKMVLGLNVKYYYYKLYDKITSDGVGLDLGLIYMMSKKINLSASISDINSSYKWDSSPIYNTDGTTTTEKFPILKKVGIAYKDKFSESSFVCNLELENSNFETNYLRVGAEYGYDDFIFFRAGIDRFNLSNTESPIKAGMGFSVVQKIYNYDLTFDYAYVIEPYSDRNMHILGINFKF